MVDLHHLLTRSVSSGSDAAPQLTRRRFIEASTALGLTAGLPTGLWSSGAAAQAKPKKGGLLRAGILGATTNSNDPALRVDEYGVMAAYTTFNFLTELSADRNAMPELAETWEAKPGATEWVFNLRKGVEFHNGKSLTADDVVYSISRHMAKDSTSGAKSLVSNIAEISAASPTQVRILLKMPNADLPVVFTADQLAIVPTGFSDWNKPIGTGPYAMDSFDPGVNVHWTRNKNYWKPDRAHVDEVEFIILNDSQARMTALQTGQIDATGLLDPAGVDNLRKVPGLQIVNSTGGQFYSYSMNCKKGPFTDPNLRKAMKYAVDRQKILDVILRGNGKIGNDQPLAVSDPYYDPSIPQTTYDPDKAKFYLKQAGMETFTIPLSTSDGVYNNAVNTAVLYGEAAKKAGITIDTERNPTDGYWSQVWLNPDKPMTTGVWMGRPTADMIFSLVYDSKAAWNEAFWANDKFDAMLVEARGLLDVGKRKEIYGAMQRMVHDDGGHVIPVFADFIDGYGPKVGGAAPSAAWYLMGGRFTEKVWLES